MEQIGLFSGINWLSVVVATIVAFGIGSLWYSPLLFGKTWQKELNISDESIKNSNMGVIFGTAFFLNLIAAVVLELFIGRESSLIAGLFKGLLVSVAWISTALGINYLFSRRSFTLFLIDAGYFVTIFIIMGAILGAW